MLTLDTILKAFTALVGWPALAALVIDVLKYFGVVNDGTAGKWNIGFNLAGFAAVGILLGFFPQIDIAGVDAVILNYVTIAAYVVMLLLQMGGAKIAHELYKKTPLKKLSYNYPF